MRAAVLALGFVLVACSDDGGGIVVTPQWMQVLAPVGPNVVGHNAVWSRGGLGLWDENAGAPNGQVIPLVAELRPGVLRFPGGTRAMRYHFDGAIGTQRQPQCDPFTGATDATRYGLDEFLQVAEQVGADVTLVAPWVDGTPEEAAAMVAYVNAEASSSVSIGVDANGKDWGTAGSWAAKRAQNGHAAPYRVKYLEIGNEQYHDLPVGPPVSCGRMGTFRQDERFAGGTRIPTTAADHAAQVARYAALVHAVDPAIKVGASAYSTYDGHSSAADAVADLDARGGGDPWNRRLLQDGGTFDFFILHPYDFSTGDARLTLAERLRQSVCDLRALAPEKAVAVTEFGFLFDGGTLLNALVSADMVRVATEEKLLLALRHILIEDRSDEPFADSAAIVGPEHALQPGYQVMRLLARDLATVAVKVASTDPDVVALATRDDAGGTLGILVIDRRPKSGAARTVSIALPAGNFSGTLSLLTAPKLTATDVTLTESPAGGSGTLRLQLPAHSLAVIRLIRT